MLLEEYRAAQGYPWPVATAPADMLSDYNIIRQATKVAIDGTGVITFRAGYGTESSDTWRKVFSQLAVSESSLVHRQALDVTP